MQKSLKIAITGATGFIGKALSDFLQKSGHEVFAITRQRGKENSIFYDPENKNIEKEKLEGMDVVINLAGENIGSGKWTREKKEKIQTSRIQGTQFLVETLNQLEKKPELLISASGVGFYGMHAGKDTNETSPAGQDFLAKTCVLWEQEAKNFQGERLIIARFGVVLSPDGGMLKQLIPIFSKGLGSIMGDGKQLLSWIALEDLVSVLYHCILHKSCKGIINVVAEKPITNKEFSQTLARVLQKPLWLRIPKCFISLLGGEKAKTLVLGNNCAQSENIKNWQIPLQFTSLEKALLYYKK